MKIPRKEHPKPQFKRKQWLNLNGQWDFSFDFSRSGLEKGWHKKTAFKKKITIPFCPESELSGIGFTDFIPAVWYQRNFVIPDDWADKKILLHFGAVDFACSAWVNGELAGRHRGGSSSFCFDITELIKNDDNFLSVYARDDVRSGKQPAGKQSGGLYSKGCHYTRTTGIWQTVWLEAVPETYLKSVNIMPDLDNSSFYFLPFLNKEKQDLSFRVILSDNGREITGEKIKAHNNSCLKIKIDQPQIWTLDNPFLYDLTFQLIDKEGKIIDQVKSYAGLRKFHIEGNKFFLNNRAIFLRFVLDQGFYPDGIWTAPDDQELKADIQRSKQVGFNGARLHQKVFEERFHYWADRMGYLTWGEYSDWGMDFAQPEAINYHRREWQDIIVRDRNHPSIVAWTPFNETYSAGRYHSDQYREAVKEIYNLTKRLDPGRPVNDASGYIQVKTDIYTVHDYDQKPASFEKRYQSVDPDKPEEAFINFPELEVPYQGQPYVVDEYGGTYWTQEHSEENEKGASREEWGYGKTAAEVADLTEKLTKILLDNKNIAGYTFTQLTDVEQEVNGVYTYDRKLKFAKNHLKKIFAAEAAIEKEN